MPINPNIILGGNAIDVYDPREQLSLKNMAQANAMNEEQLKATRFAQQEKTAAAERAGKFRAGVASGLKIEELRAIDPHLAVEYSKSIDTQQTADLAQSAAKMKQRIEVSKRKAQLLSTAVDQPSFERAVQMAFAEGHTSKEEAEGILYQGWNENTAAGFKQLARAEMDEAARLEYDSKLAEENQKKIVRPNEARRAAALATTAEQTASGTQPLQPKDRLELDAKANEQAELKKQFERRLALDTKRVGLEAARVGLERERVQNEQKLIAAGDDATIELKARAIMSGTPITQVVRGNSRAAQAEAGRIFAHIAKLDPAFNLATAQSDYKADAGSLAAQTKMGDAVKSFEATSLKNLDQFLSTAKGVVDTGSPWLNQPIRVINDKLVGSANMAAFNAARTVALTEIAKVLTNPGLGGAALSDSARHEVSSLIGPDATLPQIVKAAEILKADMHNRRVQIDKQISDTRGRINPKSGSRGAAPTLADPLGVR